jgi:succinoglycan biosynthesis transport protein ExoP
VTIQDYLRVLRERWIIVATAALVAVISACAAWSLHPPEYTAKLTLYVSAQAADTANAAYQGSLLSEQRVSSYVKLVSSTRVSRGVIRDLGLVGTPEAVAGQVSASSAPDSVLIDVAVVDGSPEGAAAIADSVGRVFVGLVAELERPSAAGDVPPVAVRVVEQATVPTRPSSTGLPVILVLGILGGAAVGLGLALARNATDTSIKSVEQLHNLAGAPNLGTIGYDGNIPKLPLTVHEAPQSPRAEAFRQLRTNLQYVDVDNPCKVIVVTSALPGEGKTTSVCNLAIAMAAAESRVLVVEADLRRPEMASLLGLDGSAGLTDILAGRLEAQKVIQPWAGGSFDVLASGPLPPNPSELLASRQMAALLGELRDRYDVVLVDSPPLLPVTDAAAMAPATDGAILVCRSKKTTREQVSRAVAALAAVSVPLLGTVFTMVPRSGSRAYAHYNAYYPTGGAPTVATSVPATHPAAADADRILEAHLSEGGRRP